MFDRVYSMQCIFFYGVVIGILQNASCMIPTKTDSSCRATWCGGSRGLGCLIVLKGNKRYVCADVEVATTTWSLHRTPLYHILQILLCPATCDWRERDATLFSIFSLSLQFLFMSVCVCTSVVWLLERWRSHIQNGVVPVESASSWWNCHYQISTN